MSPASEGALRLGPGQVLEVVADTPEQAVVISTWDPEGAPGPAHFHPSQDESFSVLGGVFTVGQDGVARADYRAGDTFTIRAGTAHRMWNASADTTRARWEVTPGLGTLRMWRRLDRGGPLAKVAVLLRHRREFRLRKVSSAP